MHKRLLAAFALVGCLQLPAVKASAFARLEPATRAVVPGVAREPQGGGADGLLQTAYELFKQDKFEEALENCNQAARLDPKDFRAYALAGYALMSLTRFKAASESFEKAIRLRRQDKLLYLLKASADMARGESEEALAASRKALEIDPAYAEAFLMIGRILRLDEKRRGEAIAALRSAIKADPKLLPAYASLGELLKYAEDEKGAEEVYRQGLALDPGRMTGRFELGRLLVEQGRLAEARELWEGRTSDEDRTFPNFVTLLERAENLKRAADALAQKPEDPEALVQMGLVVMEGDSWVVDGRQERAIVHFEKALRLRPGYARAQYGIAKAHIQLADIFDDKKKLADEALAKLKRLDAVLAKELEDYRKNYTGGLQVVAPPKPAR